MYIRTPPRYRRTARRSPFNFRRYLLWLVLIGLIAGNLGLLERRDEVRVQVDHLINRAISEVGRSAATLVAPLPTPTQNPSGILIEADNFWASGSITEAVKRYISVLDAVPNDLGIHYRVVFGLQALGAAQEAARYAERAVTADPFSADAWAVRAWALNSIGRSGEAIASGLHALSLDPNNPRAAAYLAEAYFSVEQYQRAQSLAEQAIRNDPDSFEGYWVRGKIREESLFQFDSALEDYRIAYQIALQRQPAALGLAAVDIAQMEIRNQNYDAAIDILDDVITSNPDNTPALFWMGTIYFSFKGDPATANSYLMRCVDYNPNSYNCLYLLGRTQFSLDQIQSAIQSFEAAVRAGSPFPRHYWWAANAHFALGDCTRANEYLRQGSALLTQSSPAELRDAYNYLITTCGTNFGAPLAPTESGPTPTLDPANAG
ncbi:MAG: tetratricopeptide repeat protein [Anaerolineae bacterium]|nr:tetratricopeptide repeat protein [Anaerolineae bacterium]MDW8173926.1 tetratricopeptide repeat protein [Anaerolineae bacterium]